MAGRCNEDEDCIQEEGTDTHCPSAWCSAAHRCQNPCTFAKYVNPCPRILPSGQTTGEDCERLRVLLGWPIGQLGRCYDDNDCIQEYSPEYCPIASCSPAFWCQNRDPPVSFGAPEKGKGPSGGTYSGTGAVAASTWAVAATAAACAAVLRGSSS